jgi:hypothetical protein
MSNSLSKTSQKKQTANALERLSELEMSFPLIVDQINRAISSLSKELSSQAEQIRAIAGQLGEDVIWDAVQANRAADATEKMVVQKAAIAKGLEEKRLVEVESIRAAPPDAEGRPTESGSTVIGVEYNSDGEAIHPGWVAYTMAGIVNPEYRRQLAGQKVGFELKTQQMDAAGAPVSGPDGKPVCGKFVVTQIIERAPETVPAAPAPPAALAESAVQPPAQAQ